MVDLSKKKACVVDTGGWVPIAERLAEDFGRVYYYRPESENGYMTIKDALIGSGYDNVEDLNELSFWEMVNAETPGNVVFVFTDCVYAGLQTYLRSKGHLVFGSGKSSWLENDRWKLREWQAKRGMPTPKYKTVIGIWNLEGIPENTFIKANNLVRGDMETLKNYDRERSKTRLYELAVKLGAYADEMKFMVEDKIEGVEIGYDGWTIAGKSPKFGIAGVEIKDKGYCGRIFPDELLPKPIKYINDNLNTVFAAENTLSFHSNEIRVDKKLDAYLTDQTMRLPNPPYQLHLTMWKNISEIIFEGAKGISVNPIPAARYGAIAIINSDFASKNHICLKIPKSAKPWVKLMNCCRIDGEDWALPIRGFSEIGAVVGQGNSYKEAIEACTEHAKDIKGDSVEIDIDALEDAEEEFQKCKKIGINF